ncbi:Wzz/FepE/Etk N-terminal domain-containing protein [Solwaraspora sp. WMMD1047]|uniref:Wzz/FepE/Etk N-terminal domain-containing protein n=1 Tax=Solwaraspora sp. WMMD1047 TaxID=3016102 RepID=UPI002417EDA0|nr:Wzz/FepE/Etk N-terminal domain-containing protein [Solwaraspora sp. WMMD1047]MDG4828961.1 Wzz/FepE/Etk N-terminal domain-containing protein [Solwaraspora sp. WMMD1047]
MEIVDYLRIARRRLWILLGVPVLAAGAAAGVVLLAPQQYTGTAYVAAPALVGGAAAQQYTGTQAAAQFVAAFGAAATSPRVLDEVAADTGVRVSRLRDGLAVRQVGASSQLELSYTASARGTVRPVLEATSGRALAFLFSSQVDIATEQVSAASDDVTAATAAITAWEKENKVSQPDKLYQATLNELASLRQQRLSMQAVGNSRGANAAAEAIEAGQRQLDTIGPKLPDYQALLAQRDAATAAMSQARQELQAARAQTRAADPASVTSVGQVTAVSRLRELVATALPVAGAGLLLAVALVAILELLARGRAREPVARPGPSGDPRPEPTETIGYAHRDATAQHGAGGERGSGERSSVGQHNSVGQHSAVQHEAVGPNGGSGRRSDLAGLPGRSVT